MATRSAGDRLVLSPQEPLVAGGPVEAFERRLRQLYRAGHRHQIVFEPRAMSQSGDVTVKYHTWRDARTSLEESSRQFMTEGAGVQSVAWEHPKRER
jgi:hypothetical protein